MNHTTSSFLAAATLVIALGSAATPALAQTTTWGSEHPRREQVNDRLALQNARIANKVADGQMSKAEGAQLHRNDRAIRQEERDMAAQNGGHLTKQEQRTLNQQEDVNSRKIATH